MMPWRRVVPLLLLAASMSLGMSQVGAAPGGDTEDESPDLIARGEELFSTSCVNCHGVGGVGTPQAPELIDVGAAAADFQIRTGRMPLADFDNQPPQKPVAFEEDEIKALVAYVGSLGDGPPVPDVNLRQADLVEGGQLFRANCAACHNAAGIGGALSYGRSAPSLLSTDPVQIAEAMRTGPSQMPVFDDETFTDDQVDSIVKYVRYLAEPDDAGGFSLGGAGPVTEGFVAVAVGLVAMVFFTRWITSRHG